MEAIKSEESGSQKIVELNSPQSAETSKNSNHLNNLFPELSAEEKASNKKSGTAPQRHKPRRTFHETFEHQENPTTIPAGKKPKSAQKALDTPLINTQNPPETQTPTAATPSLIPPNIQKILDEVGKNNKEALAQSTAALQTSTALAEKLKEQSKNIILMQQEQTKTNANIVNLTASIKTILIKLETMMQLPAVTVVHPFTYPTPPMCAAPSVRISYTTTFSSTMPRPGVETIYLKVIAIFFSAINISCTFDSPSNLNCFIS